METGSSSGSNGKHKTQKGHTKTSKLGSMLPSIDPFVPRNNHNPRELRSWAKRTGFVSTSVSGETTTSVSDKFDSSGFDIERGHEHSRAGGSSPKIEIDPVLGRTRPSGGSEIEPDAEPPRRSANGGVLGFREGTMRGDSERRRVRDEPVLEDKVDDRSNGNRMANANGNRNGTVNVSGNGGPVPVVNSVEAKKEEEKFERDVQIDMYPGGEESADGGWPRQSEMKCGLRDNPGYVPLIYYGLQHFLSLAGSLIFIPLIMVPAMGGTDKDTATVISTMLLLTGVTTILHSYFGTRLPLVQGSSFVYLAPALVIINAREYRNLTEHKFRHIMRELQGAIIVGSVFQSLMGCSGLMSLFLRLINPVVVAPTVAAVGLAFFSYGFPQAGSCVEIGIPQILLVLLFTLYLRGISVFGHRLFRIYAIGWQYGSTVKS